MSPSNSVPTARDIFADFAVTVSPPHGAPVNARVLDVGFRTISIAVESATAFEENPKAMVHVGLKSSLLSMPIEAMCKIHTILDGDMETVIGLDVMDWIGLREQLPANMRKFLSVREVERYEPGPDDRFSAFFSCPGRGIAGDVPMFDLSIYGMSVLVEEIRATTLARGDRIEVTLSLPGDSETMQMVGFVRHVGESGEKRKVGLLFDVNLTTDFMVKQLRLMRFMDNQGIA